MLSKNAIFVKIAIFYQRGKEKLAAASCEAPKPRSSTTILYATTRAAREGDQKDMKGRNRKVIEAA
jgi:hypothetical protein